MTTVKAATRLHFTSGKTLDVLETLSAICPPTQPPWTAQVTEPNGTKHLVNLRTVETLEVLT